MPARPDFRSATPLTRGRNHWPVSLASALACAMPELIHPTVCLHDSWLAARDEWGRGVNQPGAGLHPDDDVDSAAGFSAWIRRLTAEGNVAIPPGEGRVHADYWWIVEDRTHFGAITLRHGLNDFLRRAGGHIGYGLRPSARDGGWQRGPCARFCRTLKNSDSIASLSPATTATLRRPAPSRKQAECSKTFARQNSA